MYWQSGPAGVLIVGPYQDVDGRIRLLGVAINRRPRVVAHIADLVGTVHDDAATEVWIAQRLGDSCEKIFGIESPPVSSPTLAAAAWRPGRSPSAG
jgi:hypothetical protein